MLTAEFTSGELSSQKLTKISGAGRDLGKDSGIHSQKCNLPVVICWQSSYIFFFLDFEIFLVLFIGSLAKNIVLKF